MNYNNPILLDQLAAEYALGTLRGQARRRFERLLEDSQEARDSVRIWQHRLMSLANTLPEVAPPAQVWQAIDERINPTRSKIKVGFWRWWSGLASAVAILLVTYAVLNFDTELVQQELVEQQVAFVGEDNTQPLWVVSVNLTTGQLKTRAISATAQVLDKTYELWMLPAQGNPQSLGLMPVNGGQTEQTFSPALLDLLRGAQGLAVSIEPDGGSPTGLPTGPIVYQAQLQRL